MAAASPSPMRAAFLGHGSPMNALERNRFTDAWRAFGAGGPRPRAIVSVSAHWYLNATAVTAMARPRTIHDFYGFPRPLFEVQYPAPGDPALAEELAELVKPVHVGRDGDSWGLDHGTWSVLVHAFPQADVPVLQLSLHAQQDFDYHLELGARLAPLRQRGVLFVCSGDVVHNLRAIDWSRPESGFDWGLRFDGAVRDVMTTKPDELPATRDHADFRRSVPTPDHFLPLLYLAGLASASGSSAQVLVEGHAYGSISMTCYGLDCAPQPARSEDPGAPIPDPKLVPAEDTNL